VSHLVIWVPLAAAACFGIAAPAVAHRLPPRQATWMLSGGGALAALSSLVVLVMLGSVLVAQEPELAEHGHWSAAALRAHAPVGRDVGAVALAAAIVLSAVAAIAGARRASALLHAYRSSRALTGELVVVPSGTAAYALPGRPGRIVVGQPLLAALSGRERQAVLEHERAHLAHGHHWHLTAVGVAAALNPLLLPLRRAAARAVERWADESAAEAVGDRKVVARALANAALLGTPGPAPALSAASHAVPQRVAALLAAPPRPRHGLVSLTALLLLAGTVALVLSTRQVEHAFELAKHAARTARGA
jgi:Zn-dependent protease with chaperone function